MTGRDSDFDLENDSSTPGDKWPLPHVSPLGFNDCKSVIVGPGFEVFSHRKVRIPDHVKENAQQTEKDNEGAHIMPNNDYAERQRNLHDQSAEHPQKLECRLGKDQHPGRSIRPIQQLTG
ncbi:MAG: hypothetical protein ABSA05_08110 [Opitutaceae bacterium]